MNRNTGMIATGVTALLCGCCSLFTCVMGFGTVTGNGTYTLGGADQAMPAAAGVAMLCVSGIMILVPVIVGVVTLRKKPDETSTPVSNEPLPPAA